MSQYKSGLFQLIDQNESANSFYSQLPDYVKEMIAQRADQVSTEEELRNYAEMLTRGDH